MAPHFPNDFWNIRRGLTENAAFDDADTSESNWQEGGFRPSFDLFSDGGNDIVPLEDAPYRHVDDAVYLPDGYEPNYAYPLIVWLAGETDCEKQLVSQTARISTQNYLGLCVSLPSGPTQGPQFFSELEESIREDVCQSRRDYHIHSERIYLAGFGAEAGIALELLMQRPEWFAGAIIADGHTDSKSLHMRKFHDLQGKRVFLSVDSHAPKQRIAETLRSARLLNSAGMDVATRVYDADIADQDRMLSDLNHWLMAGIYESNLV